MGPIPLQRRSFDLRTLGYYVFLLAIAALYLRWLRFEWYPLAFIIALFVASALLAIRFGEPSYLKALFYGAAGSSLGCALGVFVLLELGPPSVRIPVASLVEFAFFVGLVGGVVLTTFFWIMREFFDCIAASLTKQSERKQSRRIVPLSIAAVFCVGGIVGQVLCGARRPVQLPTWSRQVNAQREVACAAFLGSKGCIATWNQSDATVDVWSVQNGNSLEVFDNAGVPGIADAAFPSDRMVVVTVDGVVLEKAAHEDDWRTITVLPNTSAIRLSPDGRVVMRLTTSGISLVELSSLKEHSMANKGYLDIAFSPDGRKLAVLMPRKIIVCGVPRLKPIQTLSFKKRFFSSGLVFVSDDGQLVFVSTGGEVRVCDPATGTIQSSFTLPLASAIDAVAVSRDGQTLAVGTSTRVLLCDVSRGQLERELSGQAGRICTLVFSDSGSELIATDDSGQLMLWSLDGAATR